MIEVILRRAWADDRATLGMLTIKGVKHDPIFTLENADKGNGFDSRIPAGFYRCDPYSGTKNKNVYIVTKVPGRTYILFHAGNTERDTEGCILVGNQAGMIKEQPAVLNSVDALNRLRQLIGKKSFDLTIV